MDVLNERRLAWDGIRHNTYSVQMVALHSRASLSRMSICKLGSFILGCIKWSKTPRRAFLDSHFVCRLLFVPVS